MMHNTNPLAKYRAISLYSGEFVYGYYVEKSTYIHLLGEYRYVSYIVYNSNEEEVNPATLGQFIETLANDGREVYVGDVVRVYGGYSENGYYEYDFIRTIISAFGTEALSHADNIEIMGNIHIKS